MFTFILSIVGLCLFEVVSSIDNAVINADILSTMEKKWRKWFLIWGIFIGVFMVRGLLPWIIIWMANPSLGPVGAFTASFSNDPHVAESVERSAPVLLMGGGIFLIFLFFHWLFIEPKNYCVPAEKFFSHQGAWFFAIVSVILCGAIWFSLKQDPMMAFAAAVGSSAFFITHGFKEYAAQVEERMRHQKGEQTDIAKILYLEVIDATFSIDGVVGAFAFTMSVPIIILGNGLGALIVRQLTIKGVDKIKNYPYLKNGAMYSIFFLGLIMVLHSFHIDVPEVFAPIVTFVIVGYFFWKSTKVKPDACQHPNG